MILYKDFSIRIESKRDEGFEVKAESSMGDGAGMMLLPEDAEAIVRHLQQFANTVRGEATREASVEAEPAMAPTEIGSRLFDALFNGSVATKYYECYGAMGENEGVRVKLHFDFNDADERKLALVPWEYLFRPDNQQFLNLSRSTPIVRYIESPQPTSAVALQGTLHVLVIISSPKGVHELDLTKERANIEKTFANAENVDVDILENPTAERLQDKLSSKPYHVLHYMGHGAIDTNTGIGALILEDSEGNAKAYDARQLGMLLGDEKRTLRLVFLNACDTAKSTEDDDSAPFGGVAAALVQSGVTAVLAMQFPITDRAAIAFSRRFYRCIADGYAVDHATAEGRKAIVNDDASSMEWGTPVLFMRAPDGQLFDTGKAASVPPLPVDAPPAAPPQPAGVGKKAAIGVGALLAVAAAVVAIVIGLGDSDDFEFVQNPITAEIGTNVPVQLKLAGDQPAFETMRDYKVEFESTNPDIAAFDAECVTSSCILDDVWQRDLTPKSRGEAIVLVTVTEDPPVDGSKPIELTARVNVTMNDLAERAFNDAMAAADNGALSSEAALAQLASVPIDRLDASLAADLRAKVAELEALEEKRNAAMLAYSSDEILLADKIALFDAWREEFSRVRGTPATPANSGDALSLYDQLQSHTTADAFVLCQTRNACSGHTSFSRNPELNVRIVYNKKTSAPENFGMAFFQDGKEIEGVERWRFSRSLTDVGQRDYHTWKTLRNVSGDIEARLYNGAGDWIASWDFRI